jgi:ApbE superfamily uncharacterized protein (UPF0280 family)
VAADREKTIGLELDRQREKERLSIVLEKEEIREKKVIGQTCASSGGKGYFAR